MLTSFLTKPVHIAPLAMFRIVFGLVMLISTIRFWLLGWIEDQYIKPVMHFTYYGFEWVKPLGAVGMYLVFIAMGLTSFCIMLGLFYRVSSVLFFLLFTYVELLDKAYYLNHYYFVSITAFLLTLVPAHRYFSLDILLRPALRVEHVPRWTIDLFKLQLAIVYFFAGIAKINSEWLLEAMPLRLWLRAQDKLPLIGWAMPFDLTAYLFSWAGMIYDCTIVFFLSWKVTRVLAYLAVVLFHTITGMMFPIGVFPIVMIGATTIFFSEDFHKRAISLIASVLHRALPLSAQSPATLSAKTYQTRWQPLVLMLLAVHFALQFLLPFRFLLYPNNSWWNPCEFFWNEQGYRFSWRVMLVEKAGTAIFYVKDSVTGREGVVNNAEFLNPTQEKQMSFQPDMILEFAHFLRDYYAAHGVTDPQVRAEVYVTMNGRPGRLLIDPTVDLAKEKEGFHYKSWILPFERQLVSASQ
ncbi:MAG: HTTM domain-containing protein [Chloroherpetonaceae bacterium]|nr:HTTM domain-containing protein [Chloroherpetonaceae bacterium]MCS7211064.1 HTTM domain-containing protein [Chloroherpetonaceae bacterium]MDW8020603.1 HTTM domain-containing protein [Chloroherpetonaceae bacterium]